MSTPASTPPPLLLAARDLTVSYGHRGAAPTTVGPLTITVGPGEAVGLVGPSGAGKSSLALALAGLTGARGGRRGGTVVWRGEPVDDAHLARLRGPSLVVLPQEPQSALDPTMTVGGHVAEVLPRRERRTRVPQLLAEVGLDPALAQRYPHRISGGQAQRVLIAAALAGDPALLIADEPTASLDALARRHVLGLLAAARARRGLAVLMISHDRDAIATACDRVVGLPAPDTPGVGS